MKKLTLPDGSSWPDPNEHTDDFNPAARAYHELVMGGLNLQQIRDKVSLIRQAAGRPRVPTRKSKKSFPYKGKWYTWQEIAAMGVDGLTRQVIVSRQRSDWKMERILFTPVRKHKKRKPKYRRFKNQVDHEALGECSALQLKILGL